MQRIEVRAGNARPGPNHPRRGRFWVPLLSLRTGMRLDECCELDVDDVVARDGVNIILIREGEDIGSDKRVKTEAGERFVPIHPELKRIGFMKRVEKMRAAGETKLFPELPIGANGYYSDPYQKWFKRFLKSAGAAAPKTSFHSFRHCYRDALREAISRLSVYVLSAVGRAMGVVKRSMEPGFGLPPSTKKSSRYPIVILTYLTCICLRIILNRGSSIENMANKPAKLFLLSSTKYASKKMKPGVASAELPLVCKCDELRRIT